jgi:hypothetical protein
MARTSAGSVAGVGPMTAPAEAPTPRRSWRWCLPLVAAGLTLSACGLHVSKHGVSGSVFGHNFSAASGQLPTGFPSSVPVPDASRVLGGGGADNKWDVGFAVTGSITSGTTAYQTKFQSAGYTISNIQSGSTPDTGSPSASPSTTLTLSGSVFTAKDAQWTVEVESGSTSSVTNGVLKAGEFAINITVVPASSASSSSP